MAYLEALAPTVALAAAPNDGFGDAFVAALSGSEAPANTAEPRPPAYQRRASPRAARPRLRAKAGAPSLHRLGKR